MAAQTHVRYVEAVPRGSKPREVPSGYSDPAFWDAFATIYWPDLNAPDLKQFVKILTGQPALASRNEPLRVLALGFGLGAFELPILHHIKVITGRTIEFYGVDFAKYPLETSGEFIRRHWANLPQVSGGMAPLLQTESVKWLSIREAKRISLPANLDSFTLIHDDLDYEPDSTSISEDISIHRPSDWDERLTRLIGGRLKFDLILSSFCLFHLDWWRPALLRSLCLLRAGGLFLHSKADGDENLFEGRSGAAGNQGQSRIARAVFLDGMADDPRIKEFLHKPRGASATHPYDIEQFFVRLQGFGIELPPTSAPDYTLHPVVSRRHYLAMLRSRGFSTFRLIARHLGSTEADVGSEDAYGQLCEAIASKTSALEGETDKLSISADWTILKATKPADLRRHPLARRFGVLADNRASHISSSSSRLLLAAQREYEISGTASLPHDASRGPDLSAQLAKYLCINGLLHDACLAGEFAFVDPALNRAMWQYFANPCIGDTANQLRVLEILHAYLTVLAARSKRFAGFSNTRLLMQRVLPESARPCVFSYHWASPNAARVAAVAAIEHRDFTELRFDLPSASGAIRSAFDVFRSKAWSSFPPAAPELASPSDSPSFTLQRNSWDGHALDELTASVSQIWDESTLKEMRNKLLASAEMPHEDERASSPILTELIAILREDNSGLALAQTILALAPWENTRELVIFPATYERDGKYYADDCVLFLYEKELDRIELAAEHQKVNAIFERVLLHHAVKRQRFLFAHEAKAKIGAVRTDPKFDSLEQVTQDAANMLLLDITLWNERNLVPKEKPAPVDLKRITELSLRLARGHLFSKLDEKRLLQSDLDPQTDGKVREVLRTVTINESEFLARYGSWLKPLVAGFSRSSVESRWPMLLPAILVCALRNMIAHRVIFEERLYLSGCSREMPVRSVAEIEERDSGGVTFVVSMPSFSYFSPQATTEGEIIRDLCLLTTGENAVHSSSLVQSEGTQWRFTLSIVDPTARMTHQQ